MSMKDDKEYAFDKMYAYCMYMNLRHKDNTLNDCGFRTELSEDEITIKGSDGDCKIVRGDISSMLGIEDVCTLKERADDMFEQNKENELVPMQMYTLAEFITAMEHSHFSSAKNEGYCVHQYVMDVSGNMFNLYESNCNTVSVLKITSGYGDKAQTRYIVMLSHQVEAYAIDTQLDEAVKLCEDARIPDGT